MKIRPVAAEVFHKDGQKDEQTDGQRYMTNVRIFFPKFFKSAQMHGLFKFMTPPRNLRGGNAGNH
jgi:hypothetical protein